MIDPGEIASIRKLWGTILVQGIIDYISPVRETGSRDERKNRVNARTRDEQVSEAYRWFASKDFEFVCTCAGMNPKFLRDHLVPMVEAPKQERVSFILRLESQHWNTDPKRATRSRKRKIEQQQDVAA